MLTVGVVRCCFGYGVYLSVVVVRCWLLSVGYRVLTVGSLVLILVVKYFFGSCLLMVVGRRFSGVGFVCRVHLSVIVVCCCLSGVGCRVLTVGCCCNEHSK